jgi:hypothetical protein
VEFKRDWQALAANNVMLPKQRNPYQLVIYLDGVKIYIQLILSNTNILLHVNTTPVQFSQFVSYKISAK